MLKPDFREYKIIYRKRDDLEKAYRTRKIDTWWYSILIDPELGLTKKISRKDLIESYILDKKSYKKFMTENFRLKVIA
jgi:hypothetical protein